jgi:hypothetical protein
MALEPFHRLRERRRAARAAALRRMRLVLACSCVKFEAGVGRWPASGNGSGFTLLLAALKDPSCAVANAMREAPRRRAAILDPNSLNQTRHSASS